MAGAKEASEWRRVTRENPCPVCGKDTWCTVSAGAVHCMRKESDKTCETGGWIHVMEAPLPPPKKEQKKLTISEVGLVVDSAFRHPRAESKRSEIAAQLGVSSQVLRNLKVGAGLDDYRKQWFTSWPERGPDGRYVGMVRRYPDGAKKTYPGTTHGLIYADGWRRGKVLFLPEGGSDTAAILSLGLSAIGRPSNLGGVKQLAQLLKGIIIPVVVLGERDQKQNADCGGCGQCGLCWPGRFGAMETAKRLAKHGLSVWWAMLPEAKDARAWIVSRAATGEELLAAVRTCARKADK